MTDTIIETFEEHKRILKREFERGFEQGGQEMNRKWVITWEEEINTFIEKLENLHNKIFDNSDFETTKLILELIKEYKKKLK